VTTKAFTLELWENPAFRVGLAGQAEGGMESELETPFDSIEGAHEYVGMLAEAVDDAYAVIEEDLAIARGEGAERRVEALQLIVYKLDRLKHHLGTSRRILNDLRTLRRLLLAERRSASVAASGVADEDPLP
jgi:hypothetical protein